MTQYLKGERGLSNNTVCSYRDTMLLLLVFFKDTKGILADKLTFKDLTKENIISFLDWLQEERKCGANTRNARLAALHSFFKFLQYRAIDQLDEWQQILGIKLKKFTEPKVSYLTQEGILLFLSQPDRSSIKGSRDFAMLTLMIESAARVQEVADLTPSRVHFGTPTILNICGKGNKTRTIPLSDQASDILKKYMEDFGLLQPYANEYPLFNNGRRGKLTRMAISNVVAKTAEKARAINPMLVPTITPHSLRHSKAMLMMKAGVNLVVIRDFLGHASVTSTEIYARLDNQQKLDAINKTSITIEQSSPSWQKDKGLLLWLSNLGK